MAKRLVKAGVFPVVFLALLVQGGRRGDAQTVVNPSGQKIVVAGQAAQPAPARDMSKLNDKQKALVDQTDKLLDLATELKTQVGMTNKNILSIKVVRKAEEIEQYAHRMKDEAKRPS